MIDLGKLLKIGELAERCDVSKRTVDYYTKMGLLQCERSDTNYRFYGKDAIEDIRFIEQCKEMQMTLKQIEQRLIVKKSCQVDTELVRNQVKEVMDKMTYLEAELKDIHESVEKLDDATQMKIKKKLSPQSLALIQSLLLYST
ncbi:MerR family transcriptional regulator [Guptibacillus hwajinpoensis]|uniref:DNA-binding transcriptional MerR regulator n=1 Tax=Guptibacillus hwajinpoensis TaxID=208199 RepID=A0ABU0JVH7_9BACL|nr:MerR family transcriptional regulator [Alkalihalobacillus hemicentroti]MDQ0481099.1 DNA-binding transcriptional MerR regulator [Alkalihalobacillus hemicentroti]